MHIRLCSECQCCSQCVITVFETGSPGDGGDRRSVVLVFFFFLKERTRAEPWFTSIHVKTCELLHTFGVLTLTAEVGSLYLPMGLEIEMIWL